MKIEYEIGDKVYLSSDYGGVLYTVTKVRKLGVSCVNPDTGETIYLSKRKVEPHPQTVLRAQWVLI